MEVENGGWVGNGTTTDSGQWVMESWFSAANHITLVIKKT